MELRHLRYFVAVGEAQNMSRAALKLHISQPALSKQVRDLEDELGFSLLERTAKSARLTDAGRVFLDAARAVLQRADEAMKKARTSQPRSLPNSTSATYRCHSPKFCRRPYGHFNRRCQTCASDCTNGATKKFSMGYAKDGFKSD